MSTQLLDPATAIFQRYEDILDRLYKIIGGSDKDDDHQDEDEDEDGENDDNDNGGDEDDGSRMRFNPPANIEQIKQLEKKVGKPFPPDFYDFYLKHNGSEPHLLLWGEEWLDLHSVESEWGIWFDLVDDFEDDGVENDAGIRKKWWNVYWVPITRDGGGNSYCMDLDPDLESSGNYGQIIRMWHDSDERTLEASSLTEFFESWVSRIESGEVVYDPDYESFVELDNAGDDITSLAIDTKKHGENNNNVTIDFSDCFTFEDNQVEKDLPSLDESDDDVSD